MTCILINHRVVKSSTCEANLLRCPRRLRYAHKIDHLIGEAHVRVKYVGMMYCCKTWFLLFHPAHQICSKNICIRLHNCICNLAAVIDPQAVTLVKDGQITHNVIKMLHAKNNQIMQSLILYSTRKRPVKGISRSYETHT